MKTLLLGLVLCLSLGVAKAQTDTTQTENFDAYGDADDRQIKTYCTQKTLYQVPTKLISVGYEYQMPFGLRTTDNKLGTEINGTEQHISAMRGLRIGLNFPVISRSNFILNLGLNYWNTELDGSNLTNTFVQGLQRKGMRSTGLNVTIFKPFDNKHFLLVQVSADKNGNYRGFSDFNANAITYSALAAYGWKKDDNLMWGIGLTRTYRAGEVLHIPAIIYNQTFNKNWGIEAVFPARVNLRRNFGTTSLLMFGYEIEGNSFLLENIIGGRSVALRRGELKPRITYERQITGFMWLSAQAGMRLNWRFDASNMMNSPRGEFVFQNTLGPAPYFNVSINLVSP